MSGPMIPFVREMAFAYDRPDAVSPLIRRVVAHNPGPFTYLGTGTYIVGHGEVAVIDPGPADPAHLEALLAATADERVSAILITHDHADHVPLAAELSRRTRARILGARPSPHAHAHAQGEGEGKGEEGVDGGYRPDRVLADGEVVSGPGWTLRTLATPGHTANHLCFVLQEENALFSGDHVMGWSTTVIIPPRGNMTDYYASLRKVIDGRFSILWPTHGPPITEPQPFLEAYLAHRLEREAQVRAALAKGPADIATLVEQLYVGLDPRLRLAAGASVWAHLEHLIHLGKVTSDDAPIAERRFRLTLP